MTGWPTTGVVVEGATDVVVGTWLTTSTVSSACDDESPTPSLKVAKRYSVPVWVKVAVQLAWVEEAACTLTPGHRSAKFALKSTVPWVCWLEPR